MNFKWYISVDDVVQILTGSANVKELVRTLPVAGDMARRTAAAMLFPIASHDYRMIEKAILNRDLTDDLATAAASRSLSNAISSLP